MEYATMYIIGLLYCIFKPTIQDPSWNKYERMMPRAVQFNSFTKLYNSFPSFNSPRKTVKYSKKKTQFLFPKFSL